MIEGLAAKVEQEPTFLDRLDAFWSGLEGWMQGIILIGLCVATLYAFLKWARPRVSNVRDDARAIRDTLVGRPASRDSITGRPIPGTARPSIGERVEDLTGQVRALVENNQRLDDHEKRIERIEDALHIDRRLDKIEAVQLLRTIETAVQSDPGAASDFGGKTRPGDEDPDQS